MVVAGMGFSVSSGVMGLGSGYLRGVMWHSMWPDNWNMMCSMVQTMRSISQWGNNSMVAMDKWSSSVVASVMGSDRIIGSNVSGLGVGYFRGVKWDSVVTDDGHAVGVAVWNDSTTLAVMV